MEVSEYLVGSPAFKAGDTGDPRMAGSIPVHLRQSSSQTRIGRRRYLSPRSQSVAWRLLDARRLDRGRAGDRRVMRRSRFCVSAVLIVGFALLLAGSASGQARLLESTPADGASLSNLEVVSFEFDTLLRPEGAEVLVLRRDGTESTVTSVVVDRTTLTARLEGQLPSGNYEISYSVEGSDGLVNEGSIRVSVDSPDQALSGGTFAVIGIAVGMFTLLGLVFRNDKRRRPSR